MWPSFGLERALGRTSLLPLWSILEAPRAIRESGFHPCEWMSGEDWPNARRSIGLGRKNVPC
ncbi:MAG: hypothetical protein ACK56F_01200, partial [bacterium]